MITIDTNIIVRYLIKDDKEQAQLAIELLKSNQCFVLKTVILEVVWVMSSKQGYALTRDKIVERIHHLLKLPSVTIEDIDSVILAIYWYESGMDFADALHLASSLQTEQFVTFDKCMVNKSSILSITQSVRLLR